MKTGEIIKTLRKEKGLNQGELGKIIGLTDSAISSIESGRSEITTKALKKASEFFEVTADYILTGKESTGEISEEEREVLNAMREDTAFKEVAIEAAKLKKKVINYLKNYNALQETMHA
jgi:transcriptional regulator with XRE-family HTH domain